MAAVRDVVTSIDSGSREDLLTRYCRIRSASVRLCEPLEPEDYVVQSMPDASPAKWHLAHTTWFFEQFVLKPLRNGYCSFDVRYDYLFNSYYQTVGPMHRRPERGLLTRPTVGDVRRYREHVDEHMQALLAASAEHERLAALTTLGLNHEQQHQELLLTDVKHLFSCNPLLPAYRPRSAPASGCAQPARFIEFEGGVQEIGASGKHFCFDNETPRHRTLVEPYALADRLVTNAEFLEFLREGGYRRTELWLSDGWNVINEHQWARPLYWSEGLDAEFTLAGVQPLDPAAPVSHLSYYEADAYARWAGARLPTEAEWELVAASAPVRGNLLESDCLHPRPAGPDSGMKQLFGDVWEWTASPYAAYPGFRPLAGSLGEYNGKFMCNQLVLRGGSCASAAEHVRASYRNFFHPTARWQFSGVRLAKDL